MKVAHDRALAYGAALSKAAERLETWKAEIRTARRAGASPAMFRAGLEAAAARAGIPIDSIPAPVWHEAGLRPPDETTGN